jgi:hypothetical protein
MSNPIKNLENQVFGRLTALRCVGRNKRANAVWLCRCLCSGKEIEVANSELVSGQTQSCGCTRQEKTVARNAAHCGSASPSFKHGRSKESVYNSWSAMVHRCTDPKTVGYAKYGGAGIKVCTRWLNSIEAFISDLGERPENTSLGRFGDIENYSCGQCEQCKRNGWELNCSWQTDKEQKAEQKVKRQLAFMAA